MYLDHQVQVKLIQWIYFTNNAKFSKRKEFILMNSCLIYKKIYINVLQKKTL